LQPRKTKIKPRVVEHAPNEGLLNDMRGPKHKTPDGGTEKKREENGSRARKWSPGKGDPSEKGPGCQLRKSKRA